MSTVSSAQSEAVPSLHSASLEDKSSLCGTTSEPHRMDIDPISCGRQHSVLDLCGTDLAWTIVPKGGQNPEDSDSRV